MAKKNSDILEVEVAEDAELEPVNEQPLEPPASQLEEQPLEPPGNRFKASIKGTNLVGYGPTPEDAKKALEKNF